jgi:hypothetical protein
MAAKIFISYSHRDEEFKDDLQIGLATLKNNGYIEAWDDRAIMAGDEWDHEIKDALYKADIILLLVSPNFLASRYVREQEIKVAMERHHNPEDSAIVVPIIIRPSDWKDNAFSRLQALPKNSKPVTTWSNYDEAMLDVVSGIKKLVMRKPVSKTPKAPPSDTSFPPSTSSPLVSSNLDINELKDLIGDGKTKKVIDILLANQNLEEDLRNQVQVLKSNFKANQRSQIMDTLSSTEIRQNNNKINQLLLLILDDI